MSQFKLRVKFEPKIDPCTGELRDRNDVEIEMERLPCQSDFFRQLAEIGESEGLDIRGWTIHQYTKYSEEYSRWEITTAGRSSGIFNYRPENNYS